MEKESHMEVVGEVVHMLGDRTEKLRLEPEKKADASGGVSLSGEEGSGLKKYVYKIMDHMKPDPLVKEVHPSEMRALQYKFDQWFHLSFQGTVKLKLEVYIFLCFLNLKLLEQAAGDENQAII